MEQELQKWASNDWSSSSNSQYVDEIVPITDDLGDLQGNTLVPNSPYLSNEQALVEDDDNATQINDQEDLDKRGNPMACLFVASLNKDKTDEELNFTVYNYFEKWGDLINVKVFKDWKKRPYAFVQFERASNAQAALNESPGAILNGRSIRCELARVNRTLYLSSLHYPLGEKDVMEKLSIYGEVEHIRMDQDNAFGAYVKFRYRDDAIGAFLGLQKQSSSTRWLVCWCSNVNKTLSEDIAEDTRNHDMSCLFVGNLDKDIPRFELHQRFEAYGTIRSCNIVRKHNPLFDVTFAFVRYTTRDAASSAILAENGQSWYGHNLRVSYREHQKVKCTPRLLLMDQPYPGLLTAAPTPSNSHSQPHPPGLGIPASEVAGITSSYDAPYPASIDNASPTPRSNSNQYQLAIAGGGTTGVPPNPSDYIPSYNNRTSPHDTRAFSGKKKASYMRGTGKGLTVCHWYPVLLPYYQGPFDLSTGYQMYPHANTYYYRTSAHGQPWLEPVMTAPSYQPMHYERFTTVATPNEDASTNNTCDLANDDK
ncbi:hypothetical protein [Absidia glauca]|uniref:RRM domain-containing protein n=1 Tax=Absidia glauca TaxID=4829 RepID=A0A168RQ32_ABSGL|nr:hypothetical protein [Absidia glauca]